MDHLLPHCSFAREIWSMVLGLFGVYWVMPRSILELRSAGRAALGSIKTF